MNDMCPEEIELPVEEISFRKRPIARRFNYICIILSALIWGYFALGLTSLVTFSLSTFPNVFYHGGIAKVVAYLGVFLFDIFVAIGSVWLFLLARHEKKLRPISGKDKALCFGTLLFAVVFILTNYYITKYFGRTYIQFPSTKLDYSGCNSC
jgi:hypothetical protein